MRRDIANTSPFGDDTMADLPVDYSFRDHRAEQARREAEAQAVAMAAAQAVEEDEDYLSDEDSLEAIQSFMQEEEQERCSKARLHRMADDILSKIADGDPTLRTEPVQPAPVEESIQYTLPELDANELAEEPPLPPLWLCWAIGITACLVVLALIYIVTV